MIPQALILYIETEIIPRYEQFDKAHNLSHVQAVIEESLALAKLYPEADERLAYTIAAYHDTGLCRDRATHHLVSGEIIAADSNLLQWFGKEEIEIMREAVEDHRASTDHEPRSIYGKNRGRSRPYHRSGHHVAPSRTIRTEKQNPAADEAWHYQRFHKHLMEKYAPGGYLKLWLPALKERPAVERVAKPL